MTNIYWPVYINIENEFVNLMYNIHIDDSQLDVYSIKISELILRATVEIESITKDLYLSNNGPKSSDIKYDEDAIKYLDKIWKLKEKEILITSANCHQSNKIIKPFIKNEQRTGSKRMTYSWNNSYQSIKHDRASNLKFGSIKYLFDAMAALFMLNLYFKNECVDLFKDSNANSFPINLGSKIFSIRLHKWFGYDGLGKYMKRDDFDQCLYLTKMTNKSKILLDSENKKVFDKRLDLCLNHLRFKKWYLENDISSYNGNPPMVEIIGTEEYNRIFKQSISNRPDIFSLIEYEGVLNRNSI